MDYYERRRRAEMWIMERLNNDVPIEIIKFKIGTEYGFPPSFVDRFINKLKEMQNATTTRD